MRWIVGICGFFLAVFVVNGFVAYFALSGRSQLIEEQSYEKGLVYQETIDQLQTAIDSGVGIDLSFLPANETRNVVLQAQLTNQQSEPVTDATLSVLAKFAPDAAIDFSGMMKEHKPGTYQIALDEARPGVWILDVAAELDGKTMRWKEKTVLH